MLVVAALWWAWSVYAWLTSAIDVDEGGVRLVMLAATAAMFGIGTGGTRRLRRRRRAVRCRLPPRAHASSRPLRIVALDEPDRRDALLRFAPTAILGASLLVVAGFLDGREQIAVWLVALAIDYLGPAVIGPGRGWRVAPEHFAERHGLILLIALGESIIAIGLGAGFELGTGVIAASVLGIVVVSALWWLYFDVAAILVRRRLMQARGLELHRLALHAYSYLHLPMIAGIVLFALGLKTTVGDVGEPLDTVPAVALCGGAALYLARARRVSLPIDGQDFSAEDGRRRRVARPDPAALAIPALAALALVGAVCSLVVAYEVLRHREHRVQVRHPEVTTP